MKKKASRGELRKRATSKKKKKGDCYEAAAKYLMDHPSDDLVLVHAEVEHQIEGFRFGHAFVLNKKLDVVFDHSNGEKKVLPKFLYYALGQIEDNLHEYNLAELFRNLVKYKHWGPWDLKTATGK